MSDWTIWPKALGCTIAVALVLFFFTEVLPAESKPNVEQYESEKYHDDGRIKVLEVEPITYRNHFRAFVAIVVVDGTEYVLAIGIEGGIQVLDDRKGNE